MNMVNARVTSKLGGASFGIEVRHPLFNWKEIRTTRSRCMAVQIKEDIEAGKYRGVIFHSQEDLKLKAEKLKVEVIDAPPRKHRKGDVGQCIKSLYRKTPTLQLTSTKIAEALRMPKNRVTSVVSELHKAGYFQRKMVYAEPKKAYIYGRAGTFPVCNDPMGQVMKLLKENKRGLTQAEIFIKMECAIPMGLDDKIRQAVRDGRLRKLDKTKSRVCINDNNDSVN